MFQIVDKDSAIIGVSNEEALPLQNSDDRSIGRFGDHEDQRFMPVKDAIEELTLLALDSQ